jgi:hypothetical protein
LKTRITLVDEYDVAASGKTLLDVYNNIHSKKSKPKPCKEKMDAARVSKAKMWDGGSVYSSRDAFDIGTTEINPNAEKFSVDGSYTKAYALLGKELGLN